MNDNLIIRSGLVRLQDGQRLPHGLWCGNDLIEIPDLDHGGAVDLEQSLQKWEQVRSFETPGCMDVDRAFDARINDVIELQIIGDDLDDLVNIGVVQIE